MAKKLQYGDVVKIAKHVQYGPVVSGTLDAAFEGRVGMVVGEEDKMYRVRFVPGVEVPGQGRVTDDLWSRENLKKQRD